MSAVFAGVAVVVALVGVACREWRRLPVAALASIGPGVVAWGWFYVLNIVRYGDPTGSDALFEKLGRNAALIRVLQSGWPARNVHFLVMNSSPRSPTMRDIVPTVALVLGAMGVLALILSVVRRRGPGPWHPPVPARWRCGRRWPSSGLSPSC